MDAGAQALGGAGIAGIREEDDAILCTVSHFNLEPGFAEPAVFPVIAVGEATIVARVRCRDRIGRSVPKAGGIGVFGAQGDIAERIVSLGGEIAQGIHAGAFEAAPVEVVGADQCATIALANA